MGVRRGSAVVPDHPGLLPGLLHPALPPGERSARDRASDTAGVVVALGLGAIVLWLRVAGGPSAHLPDPVWDACAGVASCAALWWRRRRPVAVAVVLIVVSVVVPTAAGASLIALCTVAVHRPTRTAVVVTALAVVSGFPQYLLLADGTGLGAPEAYWAATGATSLLCVLAAVWGAMVRARRQLVASLAERTRRLEAEQMLRVEHARQLERERIAREMHDVLGHRLSLLSMHAGVLEFRPDAPPDVVSETAAVIRSSAQESLHDLREILTVLREADPEEALRPQPAVEHLEQLADETRGTGTPVELVDQRGRGQVSDALGRTVYRIVQEGLTNARRHAPGRPVRVVIGGRPGGEITVEVRNPLAERAPDPAADGSAGFGLIGLEERVALSGGRLEHGRDPAGEFRLRARLPWTS